MLKNIKHLILAILIIEQKQLHSLLSLCERHTPMSIYQLDKWQKPTRISLKFVINILFVKIVVANFIAGTWSNYICDHRYL